MKGFLERDRREAGFKELQSGGGEDERNGCLLILRALLY